MQWEIKISGDYYEERDQLKSIAHLADMELAISEALEAIRSRLKYGPDKNEDEEKFLERLRTLLYIPGIQD